MDNTLTQIKEVIESVVAFTNAKGRTFIGVDNRENIVGLPHSSGTMKNLTNTIKQNTKPCISMEVDDKFTVGAPFLIPANNYILIAFQIGKFKSETKIIDKLGVNRFVKERCLFAE